MKANKLITLAAVAASAAIPMAANAIDVTNEVYGVKWALNINTSAKTACLGHYDGGGNGGSANDYGAHRTIATGAFTGRLVIPEHFTVDDVTYTVTTVGNRAFYNSKMTSVVIPTGVTKVTYYAFQQANSLRNICIKGPLTAEGGASQSFNTISFDTSPFAPSSIRFVLVGPNLKLGGTKSNFQIGGSSATVLLPRSGANDTWEGNSLNAGHKVVYYGPSDEFDLLMGEKTITAIPTTATSLTNVLSMAKTFKSAFDLDTNISVTNTLDLTGVTIDPTAVSGVTFDRLMFSAKTQTQLNAILGAFPATTPISIDPTGLTENMVISETYNNVHVKTVPGVTIKRTASGLMIVVK